MSSRLSATIVFKTTIGPATDWLEPTARNSNLLPVKANGLVRLRSPASRGKVGRTETPILSSPPVLADLAPPFSICSTMSCSMSPKNTEMIARQHALVGPEVDGRCTGGDGGASRSPWRAANG